MKWFSVLTEALVFLASGGLITKVFMEAWANRYKKKNKGDDNDSR